MSRGCHVREFPTHNALSQDSTIRALSQDSTRNRTTGARRLNPARCLICIWHSLVWSLPPPRVWSRLGRESLSIARFNSSIKGWHSGTTRRPHAHTQSGTRLYDDYMLPAGSLDGRWWIVRDLLPTECAPGAVIRLPCLAPRSVAWCPPDPLTGLPALQPSSGELGLLDDLLCDLPAGGDLRQAAGPELSKPAGDMASLLAWRSSGEAGRGAGAGRRAGRRGGHACQVKKPRASTFKLM